VRTWRIFKAQFRPDAAISTKPVRQCRRYNALKAGGYGDSRQLPSGVGGSRGVDAGPRDLNGLLELRHQPSLRVFSRDLLPRIVVRREWHSYTQPRTRNDRAVAIQDGDTSVESS